MIIDEKYKIWSKIHRKICFLDYSGFGFCDKILGFGVNSGFWFFDTISGFGVQGFSLLTRFSGLGFGCFHTTSGFGVLVFHTEQNMKYFYQKRDNLERISPPARVSN